MRMLKKEERKQFEEEGYLVVEGVLDPEEDIKPLLVEYSEVLARQANSLYEAGRLRSTYENLPFLERFAEVLSEGSLSFQHFDITLPRKFDGDTPIHLGPVVFHRILRNPRILDVVESLIGSEIFSNPVQHVRIKPPQDRVPAGIRNPLIAGTGWHQDLGVIQPEADHTNVVSVWIAVTRATVDNSCLVVIPGSHREELAPHCPAAELSGSHRPVRIPEQFIDQAKAKPIPMPAGAALFFNRTLKHSALANRSDTIRWSFDLRYNPVGQPSGRSWYPGFVARSRKNPDSELRDFEKWAQTWRETRDRLVAENASGRPFTRWSPDHPGCA